MDDRDVPANAPVEQGHSAPPIGAFAHTPGGEPGVVNQVSPRELPGSIERPPEDQDRRDLAFFVLWILVGVILLSGILTFLTPIFGLDPENVDRLTQLFFTAIITLASTCFGFYFATRNR